MSTLLILAGFFLVMLLLGSFFTWLSARITWSPPVRFSRAVLTNVVLVLANALLLWLFSFWPEEPPAQHELDPTGTGGSLAAALLRTGIMILVGLFLTGLVFSICLRFTFWRALLVSLPWWLMSGLAAAGGVWLVKQHAVEAFTPVSHSMSPTLAGPHHEGICPACGGKLVVRARSPFQQDGAQSTICAACFRPFHVRKWDAKIQPATRFFCDKTLTPKRFDLVVFKYPREPKAIYVFRLIGLPGEEVVIKDRTVWIDGKQLDMPEHLKGIQYFSNVFTAREHVPEVDEQGVIEKKPEPEEKEFLLHLSSTGYFVLGDNSAYASDSRDWGEVPAANLVGVATVIYWPPERWGLLR